ncbi:MAG: HAMP domain-containing sensor histidine kinase [Lachnospiraceae bacterium]|nr:HAMP domain-containing sensor histidine kinase [Lachnospiraceae bacterium]
MKINLLFQKLTITRKFTLFYAFVFSITLFLLSAGVLYSVEFYQALASHKDIEIVKNAIFAEQLDLAEMKKTVKISANKNIEIMVQQNEQTIFKSENFDYPFLKNIPFGNIWSYDEDEEHYLIEKTEYNVNGISYELYVVKNLYIEKKFLKILFIIIAGIDTVGMLLSILFGYLFTKRLLKPIDEITKTARNMNAQNLSSRILLPESKDEIYMLSKTYNEMADRIELSFQKEAQFVDDASHELKTPIAAIKGYINLLSRWGKDDAVALEKSIEAIQNETDYMSQLINKLLFLAKMDATKAVSCEEINLSELVSEMADEMKIYNENHLVQCSFKEDIYIISDKAMVKQLIRIITDNSFKFTKNGGMVLILCNKENNHTVVEIKDTGCGMSDETLSHIFDRFYTENKARNKETSGNGLGLSIAKGICNILNIDISVKSEIDRGSIFKLVFR